MFKNILVLTDGSDLAAKAVEQAIVFAKEIGAKITAMTVTEPFPPHLGSVASSELEYAPIEYMKHAEAYAETVLGTVSAAANSAGVACEVLHAEHGHIYQAIIDAADARKCDLIVMASHGRRGVSAVVLGSQTVKVLTHSKIPVLVYREWMNLTIRTCAGGVSGWFSVLHCNGLFNAMLKVCSYSSRWLRVTFSPRSIC